MAGLVTERALRKMKRAVTRFSDMKARTNNFLDNMDKKDTLEGDPVIADAMELKTELERAAKEVESLKDVYFDSLENLDDPKLEVFIREEITKWEDENDKIERDCGVLVDNLRNYVRRLKLQEAEVQEKRIAEQKERQHELEMKNIDVELHKSKIKDAARPHGHAQVKLAGFEPPKWNGVPRKYYFWKKTFIETMEAAAVKQDTIQVHWVRRSIPEDWKVYIHSCENLKSVWEKLEITLTKERIIHDIENEYRKLKPIKIRDRDEILTFVNGIEDYCEQITSAGCPQRAQDSVFINDVLRKLPVDFQTTIKSSLSIINESRLLRELPPEELDKERITKHLRELAAGYFGINSEKAKSKLTQRINTITGATTADEKTTCGRQSCTHQHKLEDCFAFGRWSPKERLAYARKKGFCFSCLERTHRRTESCPKCSNCDGNHHEMLCFKENDTSKKQPPQESTSPSDATERNANNNAVILNTPGEAHRGSTRLPVVVVNIKSQGGRREWLTARCLIDGGSDTSLIRKEFAQRLGIKGIKRKLVYGVAGGDQRSEWSTEMEIEVRDKNLVTGGLVTCYTITKVCEDIPPLQESFFNNHTYLLPLKDKVDLQGGSVDLLIGRDVQAFTKELRLLTLPADVQASNPHAPVGIEYPLGWAIAGAVENAPKSSKNKKKIHIVTGTKIESTEEQDMVKSVFLSDITGVAPTKLCVCTDDQIIEANFIKSAKRYTRINEEGRVEVALPWKAGYPEGLPNNYNEAEKDLHRQKKRLEKGNEFQLYASEMEKLIGSGFVKPVEVTKGESAYYIVHQHVIRPESESTPVRIVWNSARKNEEGFSMNDALEKGPDLLNEVFKCLVAFRENPVAFIGDIRKMFNMVSLREEDQPYHRFLWWDSGGGVKAYQWRRLIFGDAPSPDLAITALGYIATNYEKEYPVGSQIIKRNTYMDDVSGSCLTDGTAKTSMEEVTNLLAKGKFQIKYWHSNKSNLEESLNNADTISEDHLTNVLGHHWNKEADVIGLKKKNRGMPQEVTKRQILAFIAGVWDPLGLLNPIMVNLRIRFQDLWRHEISWDQKLDDELKEDWQDAIMNTIPFLDVVLQRSLRPQQATNGFEIHAFSDGGSEGFGTCVYFRWMLEDGAFETRFVASKSFVVPVKGNWTVPRTELVGALIMVRLVRSILRTIQSKPKSITYWVDSKIVLHWIRASTSERRKVFVETRVAEIQESSDRDRFRYVPSEENAADVLTKESAKVDLQAFHNGPSFLREVTIPDFESAEIREEILAERSVIEALPPRKRKKKKQRIRRKAAKKASVLTTQFKILTKAEEEVLCKANKADFDLNVLSTATNWKEALEVIERENSSTHEEAKMMVLRALQKGERFATDQKYRKLCAVYDEKNRVSRIGGRLDKVEDFHLNITAPIIIPAVRHKNGKCEDADKMHTLTLLAKHIHEQVAHAGTNRARIMAEQSGLYIVGATRLFKRVKGRCVECRKRYAPLIEQKMGQIPDFCFGHGEPPFTNTAVDFFGPFATKVGRRSVKNGHAAIFTCAAVRAVHLEFCYDIEGGEGLSTEKFLMAFRRFVSLRGMKVATLYSDNGTNFVGSEKIVSKEREMWDNEVIKAELADQSKREGTTFTWIWNTPTASHMNGRVERLIRSVRQALDMTVGYHDRTLSGDEWSTVLYEVAYLINSRPLWPSRGKDPLDLDGTISSNFILHGHGETVPQTLFPDEKSFLPKHVDAIERRVQTFWKAWMRNMPSSLLLRPKWHKQARNVETGDLVILKRSGIGGDAPRATWDLGLVESTRPGLDGLVRKVFVKTRNGTYERPTSKMCLIATEEEMRGDIQLPPREEKFVGDIKK